MSYLQFQIVFVFDALDQLCTYYVNCTVTQANLCLIKQHFKYTHTHLIHLRYLHKYCYVFDVLHLTIVYLNNIHYTIILKNKCLGLSWKYGLTFFIVSPYQDQVCLYPFFGTDCKHQSNLIIITMLK